MKIMCSRRNFNVDSRTIDPWFFVNFDLYWQCIIIYDKPFTVKIKESLLTYKAGDFLIISFTFRT